MMSKKISTKSLAALGLGAALLLTGCAPADGTTQEPTAQNSHNEQHASRQADAVTVTDPWAKAAEKGMSAAFGTLRNDSDQPVELEAVVDQEHGNTLQIHEMAGQGTDAVMQQIEGALQIPAGQSVELAPGGNHIMFMDLKQPLVPAEVATLRLEFADGSSKDVQFPIRNYDGANESYHSQHSQDTEGTHEEHGGEH
ncbi:copper chaperone PCu(A)C [Glutamicibacter creatinolyticus]|uniref:copper chaperone PCu(A)C n=1 Tax=Glutamicibacter creatinolyticus TaxID=162496 RepID=UPI0031D44C28